MNPRLIAVLASAAALLAGCSEPGPGQAKDEIIAADKAFSARSAKDGPKAAFLAYVSNDAKLLSVVRQGPDGVNESFMQLPPTATLTWEPAYVDVAASGELGYTWGRYILTVPSPQAAGRPLVQMGTYATIWKHQAIGGWRVVLDGGHPDGQK